MADVTPYRVRLRLGLSADDVPDASVQVFIDEAAAFLSGAIDKGLNPSDCSEGEAQAIANLAAIYCYLNVTGVSSTGWTANLGSLSFAGPAEKIAQLEFLKAQVLQWIRRNRKRYVGRA